MPLQLVIVVRKRKQKVIEYSITKKNLNSFLLFVVKNAPKNKRTSFKYEDEIEVHAICDGQMLFICASDKDYAREKAYAFLGIVRDNFYKYKLENFALIEEFNDESLKTKSEEVMQVISETKDVIIQDLQKIQERTQDIEQISDTLKNRLINQDAQKEAELHQQIGYAKINKKNKEDFTKRTTQNSNRVKKILIIALLSFIFISFLYTSYLCGGFDYDLLGALVFTGLYILWSNHEMSPYMDKTYGPNKDKFSLFKSIQKYYEQNLNLIFVPILISTLILMLFGRILLEYKIVRYVLFIPGWTFQILLAFIELSPKQFSTPDHQVYAALILSTFFTAATTQFPYLYYGLSGGFSMGFGMYALLQNELNFGNLFVICVALTIFLGAVAFLGNEFLIKQYFNKFVFFTIIYTLIVVLSISFAGHYQLFPKTADLYQSGKFQSKLQYYILNFGLVMCCMVGGAIFIGIMAYAMFQLDLFIFPKTAKKIRTNAVPFPQRPGASMKKVEISGGQPEEEVQQEDSFEQNEEEEKEAGEIKDINLKQQ